MSEYIKGRETRTQGVEVDRVFVAGQEAEFIFGRGTQLFPNLPVPIWGSHECRVVTDAGQKWFEFAFTIDHQLSGNSATGWVDQGNYFRLEPQWSPDLVNWSFGKFLPAPVPVITNGDGTWTYWSRAVHPQDSAVKTGMLELSSGSAYGQVGTLGNINPDSRNNPFTALTVLGVSRALGGFPYTMPGDAARMQTDLAAIFPGATVEASSDTVWRIRIPNVTSSAFNQINNISWPLYSPGIGPLGETLYSSGAPFGGNFVNAEGVAILPKAFARLKISSGTRYTDLSSEPPPLEEIAFAFVSISALQVPRQVPGTITPITDKDRLINRVTSGTTYYDQQLSALHTGTLPEPVAWASSAPDVATVDAAGFLTHLTNGSTVVQAVSGSHSIIRQVNLQTTGSSTDVLTGYAAGSLAKHVSDAVDARIAGKSPATALALYSTMNHATPTYVRNTACWAADLAEALTCISPWNSYAGTWQAGTATSPVDVFFCGHFSSPLPNGTIMRFITADNVVVERTLVSSIRHPEYAPYFPDIRIGRLDSPLPPSIVPCRILPDNWATKLPSLSSAATVPALCLDLEEKAVVTDLSGLGSSATFAVPALLNKEARLGFYEDKVNGDSGNPAFLIVNNQLVLLTTWTFGGAGSGTAVTPQRAAINAMMTSLGGGHTLQDVDLSGFPSYP